MSTWEAATAALERGYHEAVKECLGRLLPIQHNGHMLGLWDLREQLRTGLPYQPTRHRCVRCAGADCEHCEHSGWVWS